MSITTKELTAKLYFSTTSVSTALNNKPSIGTETIAIRAIKAFKLRGYKLPDDIKIIGFGNILEYSIIEPSLTTISIPRKLMRQTAVTQLIARINTTIPYTLKIPVSTSLVKQFST